MDMYGKIKKYIPFNEQEERDKQLILKLMDTYDGIFYRENTVAHMTASSWIVNKDKTKILMAYHKIYGSWAWLGGHADGETDLLKTALKEAREESGIINFTPLSDDIYSLEVLPVAGHEKHGKYISSHLHLNITYLLEADENDKLTVNRNENSAVGWFTYEEAMKKSTEPWFVDRIYSKLNGKLSQYR